MTRTVDADDMDDVINEKFNEPCSLTFIYNLKYKILNFWFGVQRIRFCFLNEFTASFRKGDGAMTLGVQIICSKICCY